MNNKNFSFTVYSLEDFAAQGKIVCTTNATTKVAISKVAKTKQQKRTKFTRVPRRSVQLEDQQRPIVETPVLEQIQQLNYDPSILQRYYDQQRLFEFCKGAREILNKKLQPDFCKFGHFLGLPSCPPQILHDAFCGQIGVTWDQDHKAMVDGFVTKPTRRYYRFEEYMPDLLEPNWYIRHHGTNNPNYAKEIKSFFTSIVFIVELADGRVWCNYTFVTQALIGGRFIDVS